MISNSISKSYIFIIKQISPNSHMIPGGLQYYVNMLNSTGLKRIHMVWNSMFCTSIYTWYNRAQKLAQESLTIKPTSVVITRQDAVGLMVTSPVIKPTSWNSSYISRYFWLLRALIGLVNITRCFSLKAKAMAYLYYICNIHYKFIRFAIYFYCWYEIICTIGKNVHFVYYEIQSFLVMWQIITHTRSVLITKQI